MGKTISNYFTLLFVLAGCVVAILLAWEHFHPEGDIGCSTVGGNCHATIDSVYGHVGPIPTSLLGLAMYLTVGGLCVQRLRLLRAQRAQLAREQAQSVTAYEQQVTPDNASADAARAELEAEVGVASETPSPPVMAAAGPSTGQLAAQIKLLDGIVWGISLLAFCISWWLQYVSITVIHSFCPWCLSSAVLVTLILVLSSYSYLLAGRKITGEQKLLIGVFGFVLVMGGFIAWAPLFAWVIRNLLPPPKIGTPVTMSDRQLVMGRKDMPTKGDPNAQVLIVEFADYQCGHCKEASAALDHYMKENPKKVRLAFRNYPLPNHRWAKPAAVAAEAAAEQGKFWEMHDYIFEHQQEMELPTFNADGFTRWAETLNLNMAKFQKDRQDPRIQVRVELDIANGNERGLGINMTPTFYVVTKTNMYAYTGSTGLQQAMGDPNNAIWK